MAPATRLPSESVIHAARVDAARCISMWWAAFGAVLGLLSPLNIVFLGFSAFVTRGLTPKLDLSAPKRLVPYFQNPAGYTVAYQETAKRVRCRRLLYGWLAGVMLYRLCFQ